MLKRETPKEWKRRSVLYSMTAQTDDYGFEKMKKGKKTEIFLCWQPVNDEALLNEYGISHKGSIQAVLYDFNIAVKPFDIVGYEGEEYEVKGIKRFLSYRLIIAERIESHEQKQF